MKKTILLVFSFTTLMHMNSCKKEEGKMAGELSAEKIQKNGNEADLYYKNPANVLDHYGQTHNDAVDYLRSVYEPLPAGTSFDDIMDKGIYFESQRYGTDFSIIKDRVNTYADDFDMYLNNNNDDLQLAVYDAIGDWPTSQQAKNYGTDLVNTIFHSVNHEADPAIEAIKAIENNIINDLSLTSPEKDHLLIIGSVMRHSLYYWKTNPNVTPPNVEIPKWLQKALDWLEDHLDLISVVIVDVSIFIIARDISVAEGVGGGAVTSLLTVMAL